VADRPSLREHVSIYGHLVGARVRADWQYRTSFVLYTVSQFLVSFLDFLAIAVLFSNTRLIAGWSVSQVAFLYATASVAFYLGDVFVSEVELLHRHVRMGTFDQFLLRPLGPLFQLVCHEFALRRAGKLLQALVVLAITLAVVPVDWDAARAAMVVVTIAGGTVIFGALWVITSSAAFWTTETREIASAATYGGAFAAQYPVDLYAKWLQRLLVIVPLAFVTYLPATWILGKPDALGLPDWAAFTAPVVAAISFAVARAVWRAGVRHYRSTGT
jgi:ABC-2 type transport system permease protein